jgi:hypothetical protein
MRLSVDHKVGLAAAVAVMIMGGAVLGWASLTAKPKDSAVEPAPPQLSQPGR